MILCNISGVTTIVTKWENKLRKRLDSNEDDLISRSLDSLINYETVKYYVAEEYEIEQYRERWLKCGKIANKSFLMNQMLEIVQSIIIRISLFLGSLLCAYLIVKAGTHSPSQYVLFVSYVYHIYIPLNQLKISYQ